MNSPEPASAPTQIGNVGVSFVKPLDASEKPVALDCNFYPPAANDERVPIALESAMTAPPPRTRVPLTVWLALVFWALGTAVLLALGAAYRLLA